MIHIVLPAQFFHADRRLVAQRRLMVAVLQTAVNDCRGSVYRRAAGYGPPSNPGDLRRATAYVASTDRTWPFSFENLCDALGLDAAGLRRELQLP